MLSSLASRRRIDGCVERGKKKTLPHELASMPDQAILKPTNSVVGMTGPIILSLEDRLDRNGSMCRVGTWSQARDVHESQVPCHPWNTICARDLAGETIISGKRNVLIRG